MIYEHSNSKKRVKIRFPRCVSVEKSLLGAFKVLLRYSYDIHFLEQCSNYNFLPVSFRYDSCFFQSGSPKSENLLLDLLTLKTFLGGYNWTRSICFDLRNPKIYTRPQEQEIFFFCRTVKLNRESKLSGNVRTSNRTVYPWCFLGI